MKTQLREMKTQLRDVLIVVGAVLLLFPSAVFAQDDVSATPSAPSGDEVAGDADAETQAADSTEVAPEEVASDDTSDVAPPDPVTPPTVPAATVATAAVPTPVESTDPEEKAWYDRFDFMAFVDAYYQQNWRFPKPDKNTAGVRAFTQENGFALNWTGFDLSYPTDVIGIGGTIAMRFGPTAKRFAVDDTEGFGLEYVKEAFASWAPASWVQLDFGKFGTIYGAEVPESWMNFNYTRGVLNWAGQPFHHTGLRAAFAITEALSATVLAVNGWDKTLDNNTMKTFGFQLGYSGEVASLVVGYIFGPEQNDTATVTDVNGNETIVEVDGANERFRHFVDVVATLQATKKLGFIFNFDYGTEEIELVPNGASEFQSWWGFSLAGQYAFCDWFGAAVRGEYFADLDGLRLGSGDVKVATATITLDFVPHQWLLIRLDNRMDWADQPVFRDGLVNDAKTQFTTTLGVVLHTDG